MGNHNAQRGEPTPKARAGRARMARELRAIDSMKTDELIDKHFELFGYATTSRNRAGLVRRLYSRVQQLSERTELSPKARTTIEELSGEVSLADNRKARSAALDAGAGRDPRLPKPGETITRVYAGEKHQVRVLADGFAYEGREFRTLSAVAKEITGNHWNGFLFFNLDVRKSKGGRT